MAAVDRIAVPSRSHSRLGWGALSGWLLVLTAVLERPITHAGYLLGHDMVFTAHQPLDAASVGVSGAAPRAVPLDALVALAEQVVDGAVVGRLAVVLPLIAAGLGCAALLRAATWSGRVAAATAAVWSPYLVERLAIGQWALLWAYAALPWVLLAVRSGRGRGGWAGRAVALAAASITPTGAVIAAVTAVTATGALRRPRSEQLATAGLVAVLQLPWLLPALLSSADATSDPAAVAAFAARPEHPGGALLSLLGGGGIWDADVVPAGRDGLAPWVWLVVLAGAAVAARHHVGALLGRRLARALLGLAAAGLLLAALPTLPGGAALLRAAVAHVPGAGLLRDSQKWIMPMVVLEALTIGAAVDRLAIRLRGHDQRWWAPALAVVAAAAPILVLPSAAATLRVPFTPVHYPRGWATAARVIADRPADVAVLPFGSYRLFAWAPGRSVLDPAPRLLPAPTVVDDRLVVNGRTLAGENRRVRTVATALRGGRDLAGDLAAAGIGWVVVEHGTPGRLPDLSGLTAVRAGEGVSLYRVPDAPPSAQPPPVRLAIVLGGDAVAVLSVLALLVIAAAGLRPHPPVASGPGCEPTGGDEPLL